MQKYDIKANRNQSDSSSEEEVVQRTPKKKGGNEPAPPAAVAISRPIQKPNIHQLYSQYGF